LLLPQHIFLDGVDEALREYEEHLHQQLPYKTAARNEALYMNANSCFDSTTTTNTNINPQSIFCEALEQPQRSDLEDLNVPVDWYMNDPRWALANGPK
jgi:hypothetical protein